MAKKSVVPAYVAWKSFESYVEFLNKSQATPSTIDTSVMPPTMSGQVRSQLRSSLRFLRLVEDDGTVRDQFRNLVDSYATDSWQSSLSSVLDAAYASVTGDLYIANATSKQLTNAVKAAGIEGATVPRAVRFYVQALDRAGTSFSPHLRSGSGSQDGRKAPKKRTPSTNTKTAPEQRPQQTAAEGQSPLGMTRWQIPIPGKKGGVILVPEDIDDQDWQMIDTVVRAYIGRAMNVAGTDA